MNSYLLVFTKQLRSNNEIKDLLKCLNNTYMSLSYVSPVYDVNTIWTFEYNQQFPDLAENNTENHRRPS